MSNKTIDIVHVESFEYLSGTDHQFIGKVQADHNSGQYTYYDTEGGVQWSFSLEFFNKLESLNGAVKDGEKVITAYERTKDIVRDLEEKLKKCEKEKEQERFEADALLRQIEEMKLAAKNNTPIGVQDMLKLKKDFTLTEIRQMRDENLI